MSSEVPSVSIVSTVESTHRAIESEISKFYVLGKKGSALNRSNMFGKSLPAWVCMRILMAFISSIAPFAAIYFLLFFTSTHHPHRFDLLHYAPASIMAWSSWIHYWLGSELLFYIYFYTTRRRFQQRSRYIGLKASERNEIFSKCMREIDDPKPFFEMWFLGTAAFEELRKGNIKEWYGFVTS